MRGGAMVRNIYLWPLRFLSFLIRMLLVFPAMLVALGFVNQTSMKNAAEHWLNPVHVYCRLKELFVPRKLAQRLCGHYEKNLYTRFFGNPTSCDLPHAKSAQGVA